MHASPVENNMNIYVHACIDASHVENDMNIYWRMQNNCTTSDRFRRFVFIVAGYGL